ncbi:hypothetical protein [Comamonas sp. JC664]|uniref:hypothetical protein n=1 Tax=Comamonas sp. JC664 TaxID=2801917 RepID=UPI00360B15D4
MHVHTPDGLGELIASTSAGAQTRCSAMAGQRACGPNRCHQPCLQLRRIRHCAGATEGMLANAADAAATSHRYTANMPTARRGCCISVRVITIHSVGRLSRWMSTPARVAFRTLNKYLYGNADP